MSALAKIGNNLNQIAKRMNATGNIYKADVERSKGADETGMAYTKIHAITATVSKAVDYICIPDKTDEGILISSYGCSPETAAYDFKFALSKTSRSDPNKAYHLIQSFLPGEVSKRQAHQITPGEKRGKTYKEWQAGKNGSTWKERIKERIEEKAHAKEKKRVPFPTRKKPIVKDYSKKNLIFRTGETDFRQVCPGKNCTDEPCGNRASAKGFMADSKSRC